MPQPIQATGDLFSPSENIIVTVRVENNAVPENSIGQFDFTDTTGVTLTQNDNLDVELVGGLVNINRALANMTFTPTADNPPELSSYDLIVSYTDENSNVKTQTGSLTLVESHTEWSLTAPTSFNEDSIISISYQVTDLRPDVIDPSIVYDVTLSISPSSVVIDDPAAVGSQLNLVDTKANINSSLLSLDLVPPADYSGDITIDVTQIQTTDSIDQTNDGSINGSGSTQLVITGVASDEYVINDNLVNYTSGPVQIAQITDVRPDNIDPNIQYEIKLTATETFTVDAESSAFDSVGTSVLDKTITEWESNKLQTIRNLDWTLETFSIYPSDTASLANGFPNSVLKCDYRTNSAGVFAITSNPSESDFKLYNSNANLISTISRNYTAQGGFTATLSGIQESTCTVNGFTFEASSTGSGDFNFIGFYASYDQVSNPGYLKRNFGSEYYEVSYNEQYVFAVFGGNILNVYNFSDAFIPWSDAYFTPTPVYTIDLNTYGTFNSNETLMRSDLQHLNDTTVIFPLLVGPNDLTYAVSVDGSTGAVTTYDFAATTGIAIGEVKYINFQQGLVFSRSNTNWYIITTSGDVTLPIDQNQVLSQINPNVGIIDGGDEILFSTSKTDTDEATEYKFVGFVNLYSWTGNGTKAQLNNKLDLFEPNALPLKLNYRQTQQDDNIVQADIENVTIQSS